MAEDFHFPKRHGRSPSHSSLMPDPLYSVTNSETSTPAQQALLSSMLRELQAANALNLKLASTPPNKYDLLWTLILQTFAVLTGIVFGVFAILAWIASTRSNTIASESLDTARNANSLASRANEMGSTANLLASSANSMGTNANSVASLAYTEQLAANYLASMANRLAFVAYCANLPQSSTAASSLCTSYQPAAMVTLTADVFNLLAEPVSQISDGPTSTASSLTGSATPEPTEATGSASSTSGHGSSASGKAGIGVGAAAAVLILLAALTYLLWRSYQYRDNKARAFARSHSRGSETSFQQVRGIGGGGEVNVQMREAGGESRQPLIN